MRAGTKQRECDAVRYECNDPKRRHEMKFFWIKPVALLAPYIERLWGWESVGDEVINLPILLPGTGSEVFFHYRTPFRHEVAGKAEALGSAHMVCVRRKPVRLLSSKSIGFVAVRFRAGSLHRFTRVPGADLLDQTMTATDLWGDAGKQIALDATNGRSRRETAELLQRFLLSRLEEGRSDQLVEKAVSTIYQRCAVVSVDHLALSLDITRRQLERRFSALTAQTPVEVRRLSRMQKVMRKLLLEQSASVLDAALTHGYYDQAHFIHDFAKTGLGSPQRFLNEIRSKPHFYNPSWSA